MQVVLRGGFYLFMGVDMIEIWHVSKSYGNIKAVDDVSLTIRDAEIFGIVGYSGAGKSTLLRTINQLEKVDEGEICIDGVDVTKLSYDELRTKRRKIGMIFQHFDLLWSKTVLDNIAFPLELIKMNKKERREKAKEAAIKVGLEDKLAVYPNALSGGQKQRVAIARALVFDPDILLSDEATSALDPKTTDDILELLMKINKEYKITIVLITHQMEVVQKICHRLAVMAKGKVIEEGSVYDIFKDPQKDLTKKLIQTVDTGLDVEKMAGELKIRYPEGHLLRLTFDSKSSGEPILYEVGNKLHIPFNIVSANIKNTQVGPLGVMYIHIEKRHDIGRIVEELLKDDVKVEVI